MQSYKAIQKALQVKAVAVEGETHLAEGVDFLAVNQGKLLKEAIEFAYAEVSACRQIPCNSRVPGKEYFAFEQTTAAGKFLSRPVNQALFDLDLDSVAAFFELLDPSTADGAQSIQEALSSWDRGHLQKTLYSMAIAFCCAIDIQKNGDKKTPGTFFEYFVGYLFSKRLQVNPVRRVEVVSRSKKVSLPTDFIFEPKTRHPNFHVPVKTSTRERVIQVWAHQRVIDGILGQGNYFGTPVFLTETKLNKKNLEVVEICLPDQWIIYQGHISQLKRIYYLDVPAPYTALNSSQPPIGVRPFADFFFEADALA